MMVTKVLTMTEESVAFDPAHYPWIAMRALPPPHTHYHARHKVS